MGVGPVFPLTRLLAVLPVLVLADVIRFLLMVRDVLIKRRGIGPACFSMLEVVFVLFVAVDVVAY